jgi:hypothetical protein
MPQSFDVNQFLRENIKKIGGFSSSTLDELELFIKSGTFDAVQRSILEKLLTVCRQPDPETDQVVSAIKLLSYQKPILNTPMDPSLLQALKDKIDLNRIFSKERERLSSESSQKKKEIDEKLFAFSGAVMVLEYYVSVYLAYLRADLQTRTRMYTDSVIDNIGFSAPGIRESAQNGNVLRLFILRILDDRPREALLQSFQEFAQRTQAAAPGSEEVLFIIRDFIKALLPHFYAKGITKFSSLFPTMYSFESIQEFEEKFL